MFYFFSRLVSLVVAYLYPAYASYKTLSNRPASEADLERWLMYWSVIGCLLSAEYVAEWLVRWIPFYSITKLLLLLYLALPQTQGSTLIYQQLLEPFLHLHEAEIDSTLIQIKARIFTYIQLKLRAMWDALYASLLQNAQFQSRAPSGSSAGPVAPGIGLPLEGSAAQQPTLNDPVSGPTRMAWALWQTYGPTIVTRGTALLAAASAAASANANANTNANARPAETYEFHPFPSPPLPTSHDDLPDTASVLERRRQLEEELASLALPGVEPVVTPPSSNAYPPRVTQPVARRTPSTSTSNSSSPSGSGSSGALSSPSKQENITRAAGAASVYLSAAPDATGRYERIDREDAEEPVALPSSANPGGGWLGMWGRSYSGYEKVKDE